MSRCGHVPIKSRAGAPSFASLCCCVAENRCGEAAGEPIPHEELTWIDEYAHGLSYGIYPIDLSKATFANVPVADACHAIYESFGAILFGLRTRNYRTQLIGPQLLSSTLKGFNIGFVIANSAVAAHGIARYFEQAVVTMDAYKEGGNDDSLSNSSLRLKSAFLKKSMKKRRSNNLSVMTNNMVSLRKGVVLMASSGVTLKEDSSPEYDLAYLHPQTGVTRPNQMLVCTNSTPLLLWQKIVQGARTTHLSLTTSKTCLQVSPLKCPQLIARH